MTTNPSPQTVSQSVVEHLSDPDNAARLTNLRNLAACVAPAQVAFDTRWLIDNGLVEQRNEWYEFRAKFAVTDLGRRALAAITEPA